MKRLNKKGISLIVLVITIIIMIIIAASIILSLNSSGIISNANKAQQDTNTKTLYEAANVTLAEYELETNLGKVDKNTTSANSYVKEKLNNQGYDTSKMAITKDGKILVNLTNTAVKFVEAGVEVGATVTGYDLSTNTTTTYPTTGNENTAPGGVSESIEPPITQNVTRASTLIWKYIGINDKGEALIALDTYSNMPTMKLSGKGGYLNGPAELDLACDALYSSDMGKARSMDVEDVNMILGTNPVGTYYSKLESKYVENPEGLTIGEIVSQKGEPALTSTTTPDGKDINTYVPNSYKIEKSNVTASDTLKNLVYQSVTYWLSSPLVYANFDFGEPDFNVRCVNSSSVEAGGMFIPNGDSSYSHTFAVRPVVSLSSDIQVTYNGTTVTIAN